MPRGGRRSGAAGKAYSNRSDLNRPAVLPPTAVPGQTYGAAGAQLASQQAMPMASGPTLPAPAASAGGGQPWQMPQLTGLDAPTSRPGEPVTAGVDVGAGPGSEVLGGQPPADDVAAQLRAVYQAFPSEDLRAVLAVLDRQ